MDAVDDNLFSHFWRGRYSVTVSFWVFVVFLDRAYDLVFDKLWLLVFLFFYDPIVLFLIECLGVAIIPPLLAWQGVGLWRAAAQSRAEARLSRATSLWSDLALTLFVVGACLTVRGALPEAAELVPSFKVAFLGDPDIPDTTIDVDASGTRMILRGGIKHGIRDACLKRMRDHPRVHDVILDMVGGRLIDAEQMYQAIRARDLDTHVDGECDSACTMIYAAGRKRSLGPRATLGFHDGISDTGPRDDLAATIMEDVYRVAGFSGGFIAQVMAVRPPDLWRPDRATLVAAGVVTESDAAD